jgi:hypothetical protein
MENVIRKILREIFTEALQTVHYNDRAEVGGRLSDSEYSTFTNETQDIKKIVNGNLEYLQDVQFPPEVSVGVLVYRSRKPYSYRKPGEESFGKNIWVVVRENYMTTLMFSNADTSISSDSQHKTRTDYQINLNQLKNYIDKEKGGDKNLTLEDIDNIFKPKVVTKSNSEEKETNVVNIKGVKYVVDAGNEKIFKKNNPSQSFELLDFVTELNPIDQEKIYNLMEAYGF